MICQENPSLGENNGREAGRVLDLCERAPPSTFLTPPPPHLPLTHPPSLIGVCTYTILAGSLFPRRSFACVEEEGGVRLSPPQQLKRTKDVDRRRQEGAAGGGKESPSCLIFFHGFCPSAPSRPFSSYSCPFPTPTPTFPTPVFFPSSLTRHNH